jgi:hypothetical protein
MKPLKIPAVSKISNSLIPIPRVITVQIFYNFHEYANRNRVFVGRVGQCKNGS